MSTQTQFCLATVPLKLLAFSMLIIADSKASPVSSGMGEHLMTTKDILDWLFAAAAVIIVCSIFIWRLRFLRASNRPFRDFFVFIEAPQQREDLSPRSTRPNSQSRGSGLTPIPLDRRRTRTRAADVDSQGRRLGRSDPDDANGDVTEKDALPAYEVKGGPPDYNQFPLSQLVETSSGMANPSAQPNPGLDVVDVQPPHPPPPSYNPMSTTDCPTMHITNP